MICLYRSLPKPLLIHFQKGTCICYGTSTAAVTELADKWQEGFFSLFGISWKCAQIITSCLTFIRQGTFPLKRTWLYGVFVYMKIHASIKFNFAIFVVFKLQVWGFWRGINNSFPFHFDWFFKKLYQSLSGKVKFFTIERNLKYRWPISAGLVVVLWICQEASKNSKHLLYAKKSYVRWYAADQGSQSSVWIWTHVLNQY